MTKKGKSPTNNLQAGLPVRFQRLEYGGKENVEAFVDFYLPIAEEIVEHVIHHKLTYKINYKLYHSFQDKLPQSKELASQALHNFADKIKHGIEIRSSPLWERFRKTIIEYVEVCLDDKFIKDFIHKQLKNICQEIYQGSKEAEKMLLDYETNLLVLIQDKSPSNFIYSDHIRVAKQVMSEFLSQVKKNGIKDNKGRDIKNFYSYLYTIVQRRMKDQYDRDINRFGRSIEDYAYRKPSEASKYYADNLDNSIYNKELLKILFDEVLPVLDRIELFIIFEEFFEEKKGKEIVSDIYFNFQKRFSQSTLTRKRKKAIEKLREQYKISLTKWDKYFMKQEFDLLISNQSYKGYKTDKGKKGNSSKMKKEINNQGSQRSHNKSSKGKEEDDSIKKIKLKHLFLI